MGPGDGIQKQRLLDLPTTIETADQNQRVSTSLRHAPIPRQAQRPILPPYNGKCIRCLFFFFEYSSANRKKKHKTKIIDEIPK